MKILLASSEVHPYSKSGGLADMVGALAKFLGRSGQKVGVVTPLYRGSLESFPEIDKDDCWMQLRLEPFRVQANVWTVEPSEGLTIYFIEQPAFIDRKTLYGDRGHDRPDNGRPFIFLPKCVT